MKTLCRSRWEYEIPDLDLDSLYKRVGELLNKSAPKPKESKPVRTKNEVKEKKTPKEQKNRGSQSSNSMNIEHSGDTLNSYFVRAFQKCGGRPRDEELMKRLLSEEVENAKKTGQYNRNWYDHPLPLLPYEKVKSTTVFSRENRVYWYQSRDTVEVRNSYLKHLTR